MTLEDHRRRLAHVFDADRALRRAEAALLGEEDAAGVTEVLAAAVAEARTLEDREEVAMRLARLADLCAQTPGPAMSDALIQILNDEDVQVRVAAGEALLDVGYERYAEVARAIERALDASLSGPAMSELPWVLAEIGEPSATTLIQRFLSSHDAEVIASAIEAFVTLGDPDAAAALEPLTEDPREVTIDDAEGLESTTTIGELAREAIDALEMLED